MSIDRNEMINMILNNWDNLNKIGITDRYATPKEWLECQSNHIIKIIFNLI